MTAWKLAASAAATFGFALLPATSDALRPCEVRSMSSGGLGTCVLRVDGRISCWGDSNIDSAVAEVPDGVFSQISVGGALACGARRDATAACWGNYDLRPARELDGTYRQVASVLWSVIGLKSDGTLNSWSLLEDQDPVLPVGTFLDVSVSETHFCARRPDGTVLCWKNGPLPAPAGTFTQVAAGLGASCGIRDGGEIECWTIDDGEEEIPAAPEGIFTKVSLLRSGSGFAASALREDGEWIFWGELPWWLEEPIGAFREIEFGLVPVGIRTDGEVWIGWQVPIGEPVYSVTPLRGPFTQVSAGGFSGAIICGLDVAGYASCTGGSNVGWSQPPAERFRSLSVGYNHACGIRDDGTAVCWGQPFAGGYEPTVLPGTFVQIVAGIYAICGLRADGSAECWYATGGAPMEMDTPAGSFSQIAFGGSHACALDTDGEAVCWEYWEELENFSPASGPFRQIAAAGGDYAAPWSISCGLREDGTIACWGDDAQAIADVPSGEFVQVVAADTFACGLRANGKAECWSDGTDHVLDAQPDRSMTSIAAGAFGVCGLESDGTITCWPGTPFTSFCGVPLPDCGNAYLDVYEECDAGETRWAAGRACDDRCARVPCGQPVNPDDAMPRSSDALFALQAAVSAARCEASVCDVDASSGITSTDALAILRAAVGMVTRLVCPV